MTNLPGSFCTQYLTHYFSSNNTEDGGFGSWMSWSPCSVTCGAGGVQTRHRYCDSPIAKYGGAPCDMKMKMETRDCPAGTKDEACPRKCF